jgi:hypothetical protein
MNIAFYDGTKWVKLDMSTLVPVDGSTSEEFFHLTELNPNTAPGSVTKTSVYYTKRNGLYYD